MALLSLVLAVQFLVYENLKKNVLEWQAQQHEQRHGKPGGIRSLGSHAHGGRGPSDPKSDTPSISLHPLPALTPVNQVSLWLDHRQRQRVPLCTCEGLPAQETREGCGFVSLPPLHGWDRAVPCFVMPFRACALWQILVGGAAGSTAAFFTTPFDVIKTRMQTQVGPLLPPSPCQGPLPPSHFHSPPPSHEACAVTLLSLPSWWYPFLVRWSLMADSWAAPV